MGSDLGSGNAVEFREMKKKAILVMWIILLLCAYAPSAVAAPPTNLIERSVFSAIQVIYSTADETVLELTTPGYTLEIRNDGYGACQQIQVEGYALGGEAGAPQMPVVGALLGVPAESAVTLTVSEIESESILNFWPCPAPEAVAEEIADGQLYPIERSIAPDPSFYTQDMFYPSAIAMLEDLGFLRSQRLARIEIAPFQINPATQTLVHHRRVQVTVHHPGGSWVQAAAPVQEPAIFEDMLAGLLLNYEHTHNWRTRVSEAHAVQTVWMPPTPSYRIAVREEGIYELTYEQLKAAAVPVEIMPVQSIKLYNNGQEVALRIIDAAGNNAGQFLTSGDRILFYGVGVDEKYTDTNIYWLTFGGGHGRRMESRPGSSAGIATPVTSYPAVVHHELNINYVSSTPNLPGYEHWYGLQIRALGLGNSGSRSEILPTPDLATGIYSSTLQVTLASITSGNHNIRIYINDTQVYEGSWRGKSYYTASAQFDQALLTGDNTTVQIELINPLTGQNYDIVYIDWIKLTYVRQLVAQADRLLFSGPGSGIWRYNIRSFTTDDIELYDITDPKRVTYVIGEISQRSLSLGITESGVRRYLAQTKALRLKPLSIHVADTVDLRAATNQADYIVISHPDFLEAIQPLADYRARQGYRVKVVNVQHIYDIFNYGRMSAEAIRDFLSYAYQNWMGGAPFFVLLVGDGSYDPRQYIETSNPTFIPPFLEMVDPIMGETAADNRYATVHGADLVPDLYLGRFPVETVADVTAMVNKTISYEQASITDNWNKRVLFVSDDLKGGGGAFYNFSDSVADGTFINVNDVKSPYLPLNYLRAKAYLGETCEINACRNQIIEEMNAGLLLVSYVGHGTKQYWAEEQLLNLQSLNAIQNGERLPIMLPLTCLEGYFHEAEQNSHAFGETIVRIPGKGAVASWSPTGLGLATGHDYLAKGFFIALFYNNIKSLGVITTIGKLYMKQSAPAGKYDDLLDTFLLLGDPALKVRLDSPNLAPDRRFLYLPSLHR